MKTALSILCAAIFTLCAAITFAQQPTDVTEYKFDDDIVDGIIKRPSGADVVVRPKAKQHSLIKIRTHFVHEMLRTVEDI